PRTDLGALVLGSRLLHAGLCRADLLVGGAPPSGPTVLASTQGQTDAQADQPQHGFLAHRRSPPRLEMTLAALFPLRGMASRRRPAPGAGLFPGIEWGGDSVLSRPGQALFRHAVAPRPAGKPVGWGRLKEWPTDLGHGLRARIDTDQKKRSQGWV